MVKPIFQIIDSIARDSKLTGRFLYDHLLTNAPLNYQKTNKDGTVTAQNSYIKAVNKYMNELAKVNEWNNGEYLKY